MTKCKYSFGLILFAVISVTAFAQNKRKLIIDQDARGPATTDQQSILLLLQSPEVEALGITVVSGDQWRDEEIAHTLRMLELTGHTDIKVYPGAVFPLINSREEIARWSKLYGKVQYQGAWNEKSAEGKYPSVYHEPFVVPPLPEGAPTLKPEQEDAAHFIIRMLHKYPNEVTIYAGGPLTNLAQVVSLDPNAPQLAEGLVVMGGSINPQIDISRKSASRREFNFWWDPEAAHIVLRAPWRKITLTTVDVSAKTRFTKEMIEQISEADTPAARYISKYAGEGLLWDELAAVAWLRPGIVTRQIQIYVDVDISHTAGYGNTLVWNPDEHPGIGERLAYVHADVDLKEFYKMVIDLFSRPAGH